MLLIVVLLCILPLLVAVAVVAAVVYARKRQAPGAAQAAEPAALDILKERLARGEISPAQYEEMRQDLQ